MDTIERKSLLYKTGVEYGDYTINHAQGCSHGCKYPCYAMLMAKRFGRVKNYEEWCTPKIVINAEELLRKELPRYKEDIKSVHFSFTTDPFMYGHNEVGDLTLRLIAILNEAGVKCTVLTKGILPIKLAQLSKDNEYGITVVSLNDEFKTKYEEFSAPIQERINGLYELHKIGCKTWVSIEPYPTPNIIEQDFDEILNSVSFVDKIIFGRLNYNSLVTQYKGYKEFYNKLSKDVVDFCELNNKEYHIKNGTLTASIPQVIKT
ncbi:radical SAM protein [Clostridium sp.]|uniref:radical SAM protein n=1 Tax=Clostridium sp. TaxID=1506 RepID=UPI001A5D8CD9|nr:radical SAM protein [Clostridium sp.]MBK5243089.1 radical SAM protein [Clostridium sp.]